MYKIRRYGRLKKIGTFQTKKLLKATGELEALQKGTVRPPN